MKARVFGICLALSVAIAVAGCGSGATATALPATASPTQAAATSTPVVVATQGQPAATATATTLAAAATATATSAPALAAATLTATPSPAPATATPSPTPAAAKTAESSTATLTVNGKAISYSYPSGWRLKQETKDSYSVVNLEGPNHALLSLTMFGMDMEPAQLAANLLDAMKKQFSGATVTDLKGTVAGKTADGYTMRFTYMGVLPMTATIQAFRGSASAFTLYTQAADSDLSSVQAGFDLIKNTLVVK